MARRLADRLDERRRRHVIGRLAEIELFVGAVVADEMPFNLLWVSGPGGVGKTTLLHQYERAAAERGTPTTILDARYVDPTPDGFVGALARVLGVPPDAAVATLASRSERNVLLLDTCELLAPLDAWLRETFLPQLPASCLIVLAGRAPLPAAWRADPGWQNLIRTVALRNLNPDESREYLTRREIAPDQHQPVLDFTHGHPLALALVADAFLQRGAFPLQGEQAPDLVQRLVEQFVQKVPGPAHRAALEAAALVRYTTEGLLSELLDTPDARDLFEWLRELSFVEAGPRGLFPHDLARDALAAELRWRNPDWYAELHRRARGAYGRRVVQSRGVDQQRILFDYVYLHRDNPLMRPYLDWQESGTALPDNLREGDAARLGEIVARHEGVESAGWLDFWLARQPGAAVIYRDPAGAPVGFLVALALTDADPTDRLADPATRAAWEYLQRQAPLRPGEKVTYFRFWMARETYQSVSATQSLLFGRAAQHYLTTPGLAYSFFATAEPDFWAPMFAHVDLPHLALADFTIDGRRHGVFAHDWRVTSPFAWLELLGEREISAEAASPPPPSSVVPMVLSQPDFALAARDALRDYARPEALRQNPLVRARLVLDRSGATAKPADRVRALRDVLREAAETLRGAPRDAKLFRALAATYFEPAPTQERAAELLDLPFSTYRRHLAAGIARVVDLLWEWEIGKDRD